MAWWDNDPMAPSGGTAVAAPAESRNWWEADPVADKPVEAPASPSPLDTMRANDAAAKEQGVDPYTLNINRAAEMQREVSPRNIVTGSLPYRSVETGINSLGEKGVSLVTGLEAKGLRAVGASDLADEAQLVHDRSQGTLKVKNAEQALLDKSSLIGETPASWIREGAGTIVEAGAVAPLGLAGMAGWYGATGADQQDALHGAIDAGWTLIGGKLGAGLAKLAGAEVSPIIGKATAWLSEKLKLPQWAATAGEATAGQVAQGIGMAASHYAADVAEGKRDWNSKEFIDSMASTIPVSVVAGAGGAAIHSFLHQTAETIQNRLRDLPTVAKAIEDAQTQVSYPQWPGGDTPPKMSLQFNNTGNKVRVSTDNKVYWDKPPQNDFERQQDSELRAKYGDNSTTFEAKPANTRVETVELPPTSRRGFEHATGKADTSKVYREAFVDELRRANEEAAPVEPLTPPKTGADVEADRLMKGFDEFSARHREPPAPAEPAPAPAETVDSSEPSVAYAGLPPAIHNALQRVADASAEIPEFHDYRKSVLNWSARNQKSTGEIYQAAKEIKKAVPDPVRREAITNWIQAGGDTAELQKRAAASASPRKEGYDAALTLTPTELATAQQIKGTYDTVLQRAKAAGIEINELENYVNQIWRKQPLKDFFASNNRKLSTSVRFAKQRFYESFFHGEQAGLTPQTKDIAKLLPIYINEINNAISAKELVAELAKGKAKDGRPLVAPTGAVQIVEKPTVEFGENDTAKQGPSERAYFVLPEMPTEDTHDYKSLDQQALHSWVMQARDTENNPIFVKGDLRVHPDAYNRLKNVLGESAIREWYRSPSESVLGKIPKLAVKSVDDVQSYGKATMLGLSPFHEVQEGTHAIGHRVNPFSGIPKIDLNEPAQMDAAQHGLMLLPDRVSARQFSEGVGGGDKNLVANLIGLAGKPGERAKGLINSYQEHLFHHYIPGLKFKTYEHILERNTARYSKELASGKIDTDQVKYLSAQQANEAYGHLNYADMGRNPTMQHLAQMALLAPDFLEARAKFAGRSAVGIFSKSQREQLAAMAVLGGGLYLSARIANKLADDDYHWDDPFAVHIGNRRYTIRSVPGDIVEFYKDWRKFAAGRVSPVIGRGLLDGLSGVNYRREPTTAAETITNIISGMAPISLQPFTRGLSQEGKNNPVSPFEQLLGSMGLHVSRFSPASAVYEMARDWKTQHGEDYGITPDKTVYPASKYQQLRYALEDSDDDKAIAEVNKLLASEKTQPYKLTQRVKESLTGEFTGSKKTDRIFRNSLDEHGKQLFDAAKERQKLLVKRFLTVLAKRRQAKQSAPVPGPEPAAAP